MITGSSFTYYNSTKILCGINALNHLPFELSQLGVDLPFVLCDERTPPFAIRKMLHAFKGSGITLFVFQQAPLTTNLKELRELATLFLQNGCNAIIALGKDSLVNVARLLALILSDPTMDPIRFAGRNQIKAKLVPMVQIPFELYTGVGPLPQIYSKDWSAFSPFLLPDIAVLDQKIFKSMNSLPRLNCALKTLWICMESVADQLGNAIIDGLALGVITAIMNFLNPHGAAKDDDNADFRLCQNQIVSGNIVAGSAAGILSLLIEELMDNCDGEEGVWGAVLLPHLLEISARRQPQKVGDLLLACKGLDFYAAASDKLKPRLTINSMYELLQQLNRQTKGYIPTNLKRAGVPYKTLDMISQSLRIKRAEIARWDAKNCLELLTHAWRGAPIAITDKEYFNSEKN